MRAVAPGTSPKIPVRRPAAAPIVPRCDLKTSLVAEACDITSSIAREEPCSDARSRNKISSALESALAPPEELRELMSVPNNAELVTRERCAVDCLRNSLRRSTKTSRKCYREK